MKSIIQHHINQGFKHNEVEKQKQKQNQLKKLKKKIQSGFGKHTSNRQQEI